MNCVTCLAGYSMGGPEGGEAQDTGARFGLTVLFSLLFIFARGAIGLGLELDANLVEQFRDAIDGRGMLWEHTPVCIVHDG